MMALPVYALTESTDARASNIDPFYGGLWIFLSGLSNERAATRHAHRICRPAVAVDRRLRAVIGPYGMG